MLSLRLFGGLTLSGADGLVTGRASQRRRLALLAILAQARGQPVSRDRLLALLWPESDTERGRHLLADSIYVLREALGDDVLRSAGDDVSLNPARITSDLDAFQQDLGRGDRVAALARYADGGPFLDGVHLSDAPEFERWTDSVRSRLAEQYRQALETVARETAAQGDHRGTVARWRQLVAEDPLSSRYALELMRALAAAGDVPGALEFARTHERLIRAELDASPDPAVTALARELRTRGAEATAMAPPAERGPLPAIAASVNRSPEPLGDDLVLVAGPATVTPPAAPEVFDPRRTTPARTLAYGAAALMALILVPIALLLWRGAHRAVTEPRPDPSIAVLPLQNLSADPADAGLADAMTEELTATLASLGTLRVIASTSTFAFRGRTIDVRTVADSLRVSYVIEGGVEKRGSHLRVRIRLVDGRDGAARWSHSYDEELGDVFRLQDDVARSVARELDLRLAGRSGSQRLRSQTRSVVANELYLHGRDPTLIRSDSGKRAGVAYFSGAIAADSTFAAAYAGLAYMYQLLAQTCCAELAPRAEAAALRAVALDDSLAEGHRELGYIRMVGGRDLRSAETELRRAAALDPGDARTHADLSILSIWLGNPDEALAEARLAVGSDPLSAGAILALARALYNSGRYDEALDQLRPIASLHPPVRLYYQVAGLCYAGKTLWPEAVATFRAGVEAGTIDAPAWLGFALARSGDRQAAKGVLSDLRARWQHQHRGAFDVAVVQAGLGDRDQAFVWLDRAADEHHVIWQIMSPAFEDLRRDPRFERLRRRLRL